MKQKINGKTKVLGLIGNPVEHTISPLIHNTLSEKLCKDYVYVPFKVNRGNLSKAIEGAKALNVTGLNVTVPYKEEVITELIEVSLFAKQIGAVNTLKYTDDGYVGYNTDAEGLHKSLLNNDIVINNNDIVIIGAGGAAKAVGILCGSENANSITIVNRTKEKAQNLANNIKKYYNVKTNVLGIDEIDRISSFDIAFQTTPIGMSPNTEHNPIIEEEFYKKFHTAVDLIYNPYKTKFLLKAQENGIKILNGFEMLYYQGVRAYEIWNDIEIKQDILEDVKNQIIDSINLDI
ncbi:MAG: shikimate dehydrogenase [Vallitalea sp.]|jgi:shikimate dehydrogenase|nr:shikimate dehydrogenase [Vallitalea sp.]